MFLKYLKFISWNQLSTIEIYIMRQKVSSVFGIIISLIYLIFSSENKVNLKEKNKKEENNKQDKNFNT